MYKALIADLDIEPQQVEIEALIIDIDRSKLASMGVEWGSTFNGKTPDMTGNAIPLPLPGSTLLISNAARFYASIKAMEGTGDVHVLAKPTVLTLDNVAAVLDLSQTAYVSLVGERVADLANVTAGTMLRVVPRIVREGANTRVRLEVDIEDGSLPDASLKTAVTRSSISTQAIVGLQQTLMIGGYHSESHTVNKQKVPVLGDIPLVGGLFRSNSENHSERERLFLITPRLVGSAGVAAPPRSKASQRAQSIVQAEQPRQERNVAPVRSAPLNPVPPVNPAPSREATNNQYPTRIGSRDTQSGNTTGYGYAAAAKANAPVSTPVSAPAADKPAPRVATGLAPAQMGNSNRNMQETDYAVATKASAAPQPAPAATNQKKAPKVTWGASAADEKPVAKLWP
jgi:type III secretion protein C